jgi:hypothetical protein
MTRSDIIDVEVARAWLLAIPFALISQEEQT